MAKMILTQLKETGKVIRGWLGVSVQMVTPELAKSFGMEAEKGALVAEVTKDSPAEKSGIQGGDIILDYDGHAIHEMSDLPRLVASTPVGKKVKVVLLRDGKQQTVPVVIEQMRDGNEEDLALSSDKLGVRVADLTPERAQQLRVKGDKGVVITEVQPEGLADRAGLQEGDIIREINGMRINNVADYSRAIASVKKGEYLKVLLRRNNSSMFVALRPE
jgi:serine protease Do